MGVHRGMVVAVASLALLLAGCEWLEGEPTPELPPLVTGTIPARTTTPEASGTPSATPGDTATPDPVPEQPAMPTVVPEDLEGLETHSESNIEGPYRYFAAYPVIEDFPLLGEILGAAILEERTRFEVVRGPFDPVPPEATGPSFNVSYDFLVASGGLLGVRLNFYEFFGANGAESSAVFWFDLEAGEALPPTAIFAGDESLQAVADDLRDALLEGYRHLIFPADMERYLVGAATNLRTLGFTAEGDFIVEFDEYSIGPGSLGRLAITLPYEQVEPYLSDLGRRVRAEVLEPSGPVLPPAPTPGAPPEETEGPSTVTPPPSGAVNCAEVACLALTFDDGPGRYTAELLDMLADAGVPATFFVVGVSARSQPGLLTRMALEGHEIGNHSFSHRDLTTLGADEIAAEWEQTSRIIAEATGRTPSLFRPPYGATNDLVRASTESPFILWSLDPRDWADRDTAIVVQRVLDGARPGAIILLHDSHLTTVEAVPAILTGLRERGLTLVTVSTLLDGRLAPGLTFTNR